MITCRVAAAQFGDVYLDVLGAAPVLQGAVPHHLGADAGRRDGGEQGVGLLTDGDLQAGKPALQLRLPTAVGAYLCTTEAISD